MSRIFINGVGAVSPAGWGVIPLCDALANDSSLPPQPLLREGWQRPLAYRAVPSSATRPAFLGHARLRRTSPISQFAAAAALEALGEDAEKVRTGQLRLGVILAVMSGCVNYSRRFYDEALKDPATASPLVFPETVFNAPASHLAALLGTTAINYTLVGDPGTFLQGLALAADWLLAGRVDECVVIGAEEFDWLTADAFHLFERKMILGAGAGAVRLACASSAATKAELICVTSPRTYVQGKSRLRALQEVRRQLPDGRVDHLLCDSRQTLPNYDAAETEVWRDWPGPRRSPKAVLGEGLAAASAWQCVAAIEALATRRHSAASVSVMGCNEQAIGAHFAKPSFQI